MCLEAGKPRRFADWVTGWTTRNCGSIPGMSNFFSRVQSVQTDSGAYLPCRWVCPGGWPLISMWCTPQCGAVPPSWRGV